MLTSLIFAEIQNSAREGKDVREAYYAGYTIEKKMAICIAMQQENM